MLTAVLPKRHSKQLVETAKQQTQILYVLILVPPLTAPIVFCCCCCVVVFVCMFLYFFKNESATPKNAYHQKQVYKPPPRLRRSDVPSTAAIHRPGQSDVKEHPNDPCSPMVCPVRVKPAAYGGYCSFTPHGATVVQRQYRKYGPQGIVLALSSDYGWATTPSRQQC